ncbi:MAG: phosphohistidine phosphatase SixA [Terriglobia bacterium]
MASGKKNHGKGGKEQRYELYLMRHGIAADSDGTTPADDAKRPLTPEGKLKLRASARGLEVTGADLDWIVSSPLKRAAETAEIIAAELAPEAVLEHCEALAPGMLTAQKLISFLSQNAERHRVLAIGHEPSLSELASELMGASQRANFAFRKGGCCLITFDEFPPKSPGLLNWWLTPRLMRKLNAH